MTETSRRTVLGSLVTAVSVGVAGCSGGGDGGDGGNDESGGTTSGGDSNDGGGESSMESVTNELDGFRVVDHSGEVDGENYAVTADVKNVGDQTASIIEHGFELVLYDSSGNDITGSGNSVAAINQGEWTAGKTIEIQMSVGIDGEPSDVASYEIVITCDSFDDGVYC